MNKQLFLKRKRKAIKKVLKRGYLSCIKIKESNYPKLMKDVAIVNIVCSCGFHINCIRNAIWERKEDDIFKNEVLSS